MAVSKVLLLLSTMVVAGSSKNIVETAQGAAPEFTILVEALTKAKLVTALSGTGPFTVFAPTNAAFTAALTALNITKAQLLARADLADILKYHVLNGKILAASLTAKQSPATLQGAKVSVTKDGATVKFATATVSSADLSCDNGVIHTIDAVVLPPTIVQTAVAASPEFTVLVEALTKAKLVDTLSGAGPFTVFAPTNAAFTAALTALSITKEQLLARADLADILKYHVLSGKTLAADLSATQSPKTVQGSAVTIVKTGASVTFGAAKVTGADIVCGNGVIHQIDKVVLPPTIVQTAVAASPEFTVLVEALTKAKLVDTLSGVGPFTVFAPTNAAFTAALTALNITKAQLLARADLGDILKYHVLSGKTLAAALKATQSPKTVQGSAVTIVKTGSVVTFGGGKVIGADIVCSNGVIHKIDKVVLPPAAAATTAAPKTTNANQVSGSESKFSSIIFAMGVAIIFTMP